MSLELPESDWKLLRKFHDLAVERFSQRILNELSILGSDTKKSAHQRYRDCYDLVQRRDKEIGQAFNDLRRSTALIELNFMRSLNLLTNEEFAQFSQITQHRVDSLLNDQRA